MNRFSVKSLLALGLLIALVSFNACQKEKLQLADTTGTPSLSATDRAPLMYGVTLYGGPGKPSRLIEMNVGTGAITGGPTQVFINNGVPVNLDDLKGVCIVNGQVFVTTGPNCPFPYANALIKVNPATGQAGFISSSPAFIGAVSDIDYDEQTGTIYGLRNNTNTLISITDNGNNWGTYLNVGNITNLGTYVAKGLSMVRDGGGTYITVGASTNSALNTTRIFSVPATAGVANFLASVNPLSEMNQSHCGMGFQIAINSMIINRGPTVTVSGLNSFPWANPLPNPSNSALWGATGFIFEDLSSAIQ